MQDGNNIFGKIPQFMDKKREKMVKFYQDLTNAYITTLIIRGPNTNLLEFLARI